MSENIYGGPFPWANLFGVSGLGGGMSDEDLAWQAYLEYSGLPQAGVSGADYLGSFLPEIDTSVLPPEVAETISGDAVFADETIADSDIDLSGLPSLAEQIAGGTLTASASGEPGPVSIYDTITDGTTTVSTFSGPNAGKELLENSGIDTTGMTPQEIAQAVSILLNQTEDIYDVPGSQTIDDSPEDDLPEGGSDDDEQPSILDLLGWPYGDVSVPSDEDVVNETINDLLVGNDLPEGDPVDDEEEDYFILPGDQPSGVSPGEGVIDDTPYDEDDLIDTEVDTEADAEVDTEADADVGEGGGIKDWLSKAYDKLGIQGILGILSLLGLGKAAGASGRDDQLSGGGIGSFASSQFDPSGFGATADYANMPGGGVGQPTWLPNTNAPIYYPFASEVTKQYNAQQGGPFSFTAGPPPEAMIQNLTPQRIPGVTYVADGAFVRRNGLTEGPGTETSDDIPAMLSDGEFVTNAEANRGIGAMALLNQGMPQEVAMDPEQQRLAGARQMYLQQAMGQQLAKQMRNR